MVDLKEAQPPERRSPQTADGLTDHFLDVDVPRLFALVQEFGGGADSEVAAWGLAFVDHAEIVGIDGRMRMSTGSLEYVVRAFTWDEGIVPRLVWMGPQRAGGIDC